MAVETSVAEPADRFLARGKWMVGLGLLACVVACAAPFLVGLLGLGTGIAVLAPQAERLAMSVVAGGALLIGVGAWRRRGGRAQGAICDDSCACAAQPGAPGVEPTPLAAPPAPLADERIACTLDGKGMRNRLEEFRDAFARGFITGGRIPGGFRWRFRALPGLERDLRALADREHECCRFFSFDLFAANQGREIWWEVRASADAAPVLEEFFGLPEQLGLPSGIDLDAVQRSAETAFRRADNSPPKS
jgi:hypothetical protein